MKGTFTVIKADGTVISEPVTKTPEYEKIKEGLDGGWLEAVPLFDEYNGERCIVFCNEDGRQEGLLPNATATALWHGLIRASGRRVEDTLTTLDVVVGLVGPIVIISGDEELLRDV